MKREFKTQVSEYAELNKLAAKAEIVFMGADFLYGFPLAELCGKLCIDEKIYNRSVPGMLAEDAEEIYAQVVSPLKPEKLILNLGEGEKSPEFLSDYEKLIDFIAKDSPATEVMLMSVISEKAEGRCFNDNIRELAQKKGIVYIDAMESITGEKGEIAQKFITPEGQFTAAAYVGIWRKVYHYLRKGNLSYYNALGIFVSTMLG